MSDLLLNQLTELKLHGMQQALHEQSESPNQANLSFEERLSLMCDREILYRDNKRIARLLSSAKLRYNAAIEEIAFNEKRNLNKAQCLSLASCQFIKQKHNLIITGPTGCGKTYLACALGHQACRMGYKVRYLHLPKFFEALLIAHADGSFAKLMTSLQKTDLLILDDFGLTGINDQQRHDLFNLIEERYQIRSTMLTSQLPVSKWHDFLNEPTIADAILDRLLENVHRIELEGESMRKKQANNATLQIDPS